MSNNKRKSSSLGLFLEHCTSFLKLFPLIDDKRVDGSTLFSKIIFILYLPCLCLKAAYLKQLGIFRLSVYIISDKCMRDKKFLFEKMTIQYFRRFEEE